jgi:hypothetical protein
MQNNFQTIKANLKPGDILLSRKPGSPISETIQGITRSKWSHSFLYIGDDKIIDIISSGVKIRKLEAYTEYELGLFRVTPDLTEEEVQKLIKEMRKLLGIHYGWLQLLWLAFLRLLGKNEDPDWGLDVDTGVTCSEAITKAYLKIGKHFKNLPPSEMEPADLDESAITVRIA